MMRMMMFAQKVSTVTIPFSLRILHKLPSMSPAPRRIGNCSYPMSKFYSCSMDLDVCKLNCRKGAIARPRMYLFPIRSVCGTTCAPVCLWLNRVSIRTKLVRITLTSFVRRNWCSYDGTQPMCTIALEAGFPALDLQWAE
ncbi:hypothetical protein PHET_00714 [Paragonimus heterotremus]|uniref:Uncharacterized protein n=1 Tax=Paragonimus heterotremus TaxID=100268 RepID=A0A8J4T669_9TREM|nr:hypothetical protein PHET_00714 [Paragonimus heterotremus]